MKEILPCPFCGKEAAFGKTTYMETSETALLNGQNVFHFVKCVWCGANNQNLIGYLNTDDALNHWNTRKS